MTVCVRLSVASEIYAMPVAHVWEVANLGETRAVPGGRPELLGILNLRGQILPVFDLASLLGIPRTTRPGRLLVVEAGGRRTGFAVDEVIGIGEVADPGEEAGSDVLAGAALSDGDLIGVIDMTQVLASLDEAPS